MLERRRDLRELPSEGFEMEPLPSPPARGRKWRTRTVLGRFLSHRMAVGALLVLAILGIGSLVGSHLWRYGYAEITPQFASGPSLSHPFGTDDIGHDILAQVMSGTEKDIQIALLVAVTSTTIGGAVGAIAGFYGSLVDGALMRLTDLVLCIPMLAVLIVLAANLSQGSSWIWIALIVSALLWTYPARIVRASFISLREQGFVEAARAMGAKDSRIILRHLLPNSMGPIIVNGTLTVAYAILLESTLSFLGLGIQPPSVSLGLLVAQGEGSATTQWWLFAFPALVVVMLVMAVNFVGDGLRDAFDPTGESGRA